MEKITKFKNRMESLGIYLELSLNYPWVYIDKINGQRVKEGCYSEHKFTLALVNNRVRFVNLPLTFRLIRKYTNRHKLYKMEPWYKQDVYMDINGLWDEGYNDLPDEEIKWERLNECT